MSNFSFKGRYFIPVQSIWENRTIHPQDSLRGERISQDTVIQMNIYVFQENNTSTAIRVLG